jgi:predicted nuclease with TOPRIM domain
LKKVEDFSKIKSNANELKQELDSYIMESFAFLQEIQEKLDSSLKISATFTEFSNLCKNNSRFQV